jgi:hypothetical protein
MIETQVEGYPTSVFCALTVRVVPDAPAMASGVEGLGFDEIAIVECLGPGVPVDLEDVRPHRGLRDDG